MRKLLIATVVAALVGTCLVAPASSAKKKKKKKKFKIVSVDQQLFLRRDACGSDNDNTRLSLEDGEDAACWFSDAGLLYDAIVAAAEAGAPFDSEVVWSQYPAENGLPLKLDATKPVTGEITLYGGSCLAEVQGTGVCSPTGLSVGQAVFRMRLVGTIDGEEQVLGTAEDSFDTAPGETHTTEVSIEIDSQFDRAKVTELRLDTTHGGNAYGPGGIEYDDPASYINVPILKRKRVKR